MALLWALGVKGFCKSKRAVWGQGRGLSPFTGGSGDIPQARWAVFVPAAHCGSGGVWPHGTAVVSPCHLPDSQHLSVGNRGSPSQGPAFSFGGSKLEAFPLLMGILQ